jgi:hypothetical protein
MVQTRSGKGVYDDVPESSNRHHGTFHLPVPPPSPPAPPVSLEQLLAPLNAIMQRLVAIDEQQAVQSQPHQHHKESYFDFLATQPPEFAKTTDPLEANYWIWVTESMFGLLHYSKLQNTLFTAQQLCGPTTAWWATYTTALQDNHQVSRSEFCKAFRECHLSAGIVHHKLWEFLHLQQGTDSVNEYIRKFNYLQQYGGYHVDTDEKKAELFRNGLRLPLDDRLVLHRDLSFDALVSTVIEQEGLYQAVLAEEEKMKKEPC